MNSKLTIHLQEMAYLYCAIGRVTRDRSVPRECIEKPWIRTLPDGWTIMHLDKRLLRTLCAFLGCTPEELQGSSTHAPARGEILYYEVIAGDGYIRTAHATALSQGEVTIPFRGIRADILLAFAHITGRDCGAILPE